MKETEKVDAVIVGSGAAGSLFAANLAQSGKSVVILEAGPERTLKELYSSQIWARRLKWAGPPTETGGPDPVSVAFGSGWGTGGAAVHHYANWLRLHPEDFEMQSRFDRGLNWPIAYDGLRPFYDRIQREVGISGDAQAEVWRPPGEPYPMPPLPVFAQGQLIAQGFSQRGLRTAPVPMAINSVTYKGRAACANDGWCDAGCTLGALANPLVLHLPQALAAGATIRHHSYVTRVLTNTKGDRAHGVEYYDATGQRRVQEAAVVVLAAFAVQNPRILLNSATARHPQGLANSSGLVGRYLMAHSTANVFGLFKEETENFMGRTGGQLLSQEGYAKDPRKGYLGSSQWLIGNALKPTDLLGIANSRPELFGTALHEFLATASKHLATMTFVGEKLPNRDDCLVLSEKKDQYGFPLARITHAFGPDDLKCFEAGMTEGRAVFAAAGAYDVWVSGRARMHLMGGALMGRDARTSVTNSYGQTHDIGNLFIAGSSLFPTGGAVNPTFTIYALALRSAEYMLDHWASLVQ
jgi:choline dehydrogenase-like flavoprotein